MPSSCFFRSAMQNEARLSIRATWLSSKRNQHSPPVDNATVLARPKAACSSAVRVGAWRVPRGRSEQEEYIPGALPLRPPSCTRGPALVHTGACPRAYGGKTPSPGHSPRSGAGSGDAWVLSGFDWASRRSTTDPRDSAPSLPPPAARSRAGQALHAV